MAKPTRRGITSRPIPRTPLHETLADGGAAFGEADGWEMPKHFQNVPEEYRAAREAVAVADRSHLGRLSVSGAKRIDLLQRITTNDLRGLQTGQGTETILCTQKARIIDRLFLHVDDDSYTMVTSPNTAGRVREAIEKVRFRDDVTMEEITSSTAMIGLVGPAAAPLLERLGGRGVGALGPCHWKRIEIAGAAAITARSASLPGGGFDLIVEASRAGDVARALLREGAGLGGGPIGSEAMEILRVESGVPAWGREITEEFNPLEARLDGAVSWKKGCYTGQEVILRLDSRRKVQRFLVGILVEEGGVPEPRSRLFAGDTEIGVLTSVAPSLALTRVVALGYVRSTHEEPGTRVEIHSGGAVLGASVAALPFVRPPSPSA